MRVVPITIAVAVLVTGCSNVSSPPPESTTFSYGTPVRDSPYPDGILPVGDGMFDSSAPRDGYVYTCPGFGASLGNNDVGGAVKRGPWFTADGTGWDPSKKPSVQGDVPVPGRFDMKVEGDKRVIDTNSLPAAHTVGKFPVSESDPAFDIDPNPNTTEAHDHEYVLPASPAVSDTPGCVGHQIGVMTRGAALFSPLDAEGRDAVAWEVQDHCHGHPEPDGTYHYHGPSPCLPGTDTDQVIGFALDGFPITGNRDSAGTEIYSRDLDECHGGYADVELDGKTVNTYRYVMTRDYPYTVACFKGGDVNSN